jgi:hypothetical protein
MSISANTPYVPFWNITFSILIVLTLSTLVQDGMFSDGVLYTCVSRNLAHGKGSFWFPYFNETMFPFFHQQPPLTFGIQSLFFQLGDSIYVERFYSFLTLCITAFLVHRLWIAIHEEDETASMSWLPVLLWIIIPVSYWSYSNNLEENTMGVFTLLSILFMYKGLHREKVKISYLVAGSLLAFIASLCKGFPGLFPIAIPFFYGWVFRSYSFSKILHYSAITIGTLLLAYGLLLLNPHARNSLWAYLHDRVINSIVSVSTEDDRFYLIKQLLLELLSPLFLVVITAMLLKLKSFRITQTAIQRRNMLLFFLIGISASFPLVVTLEQRRFYLATSLPCYALAFALIIAPALQRWIVTISMKTKGFALFRRFSFLLLLLACAYSFSFFGKTSRDQDKLHDIYLLGKTISPETTIKVYPETWDDWGLHNYFVRHYNISLAKDDNDSYTYFLVDKLLNRQPPATYVKLDAPTLRYDLYKKKAE